MAQMIPVKHTSVLLAILKLLVCPCDAGSKRVQCTIPLPVCGHGGITSLGGATVQLITGGSRLDCGSEVPGGRNFTISEFNASGIRVLLPYKGGPMCADLQVQAPTYLK